LSVTFGLEKMNFCPFLEPITTGYGKIMETNKLLASLTGLTLRCRSSLMIEISFPAATRLLRSDWQQGGIVQSYYGLGRYLVMHTATIYATCRALGLVPKGTVEDELRPLS
jgi:hypothetical protein